MRARLFVSAIALLTGCTLALAPGRHAGGPLVDGGPDSNVDAGPRPDGDVDGGPCLALDNCDGDPVTATDGDCDDDDPNVYPGAPPICGDGQANDCIPSGVPGMFSPESGFYPPANLAEELAGASVDVDVLGSNALAVYVRDRQVHTRGALLTDPASGFGAEHLVYTPLLDTIRAVSVVATSTGFSVGVLGTGPATNPASAAWEAPYGAVCAVMASGEQIGDCVTLVAIDLDEAVAMAHAAAVLDIASVDRGAGRHVFVEEYPARSARLFSVTAAGEYTNQPVPIPVGDARLAGTDGRTVVYWGENGGVPEMGVVPDVAAGDAATMPETFVLDTADASIALAASGSTAEVQIASWHLVPSVGITLQRLTCAAGVCEGVSPESLAPMDASTTAIPFLQVEELAGYRVVTAIEQAATTRTLAVHFAARTPADSASLWPFATEAVITDMAMSAANIPVDGAPSTRVLPIVVAETEGGVQRVWATLLVGCSL